MTSFTSAIVGASGYAGAELVDYLLPHPSISVEMLCSRRYAGEKFSDHYPRFSGRCSLKFEPVDVEQLHGFDLVFLSTPHGTSMEYVQQLRDTDCYVVDLAADYRFRDPDRFERVYDQQHSDPEGFDQAVYGLPEFRSDSIRDTSLVANPGCYATSMLVPLIPLRDQDLIETPLFVDSKSGISGAGRSPSDTTTFVQCNEEIRPYKIGNHRHQDEVLDQLPGELDLHFVPHVVPMDRGIESALYCRPGTGVEPDQIRQTLRSLASDHSLVRYHDEPAGVKSVTYTPYCDLSVVAEEDWLVVFSTLDNLGKGAASQAVQNANLMLGLDSHTGLLPDQPFAMEAT